MAGRLVACQSCGGKVALAAAKCPHCGEVGFTKSRETMNAVGGVIFLALFTGCIAGAALFAKGCGDILLGR